MDNTPMDRPNTFIKATFYLCMLCILPVAAENLNIDKVIAEELTEKQTIDPLPDTSEQKQEQKQDWSNNP